VSCGQTDIETLQEAVKEGKLSLVARNSGEKRCAMGPFW